MLIPCGHRVIIKPDPIEKETKGGIVIVHQDERLVEAGQQMGTIHAIGPDAWKAFRMLDADGNERNGRPWAEVGDRVWFSKYAGKFISDPDEEEEVDYLLLNDEDVQVIVGKKDA